MTYGKIINGKINYLKTTKFIIVDGKVITNPTSEILLQEGWKAVYNDSLPESKEGFTIKEVISETESTIKITYEYEEVENND